MIELHHIGIATDNAQQEAQMWSEIYPNPVLSALIHDPVQRVNLIFLSSETGRQVSLEFVEPANKDSPVNNLIKKGGGFYHLCYEVNDLEAALVAVKKNGALILQNPVNAAAFDGRRIAWFYTRNRRLIEYLERE
ncbi:MAG: VOC family protein [bacterium]